MDIDLIRVELIRFTTFADDESVEALYAAFEDDINAYFNDVTPSLQPIPSSSILPNHSKWPDGY